MKNFLTLLAQLKLDTCVIWYFKAWFMMSGYASCLALLLSTAC